MFNKINEEFNLSGNFNVNANNKRNINNNINNATWMLALPYKGEGGHKIITSINKSVKKFCLKTMLHRMFMKVRS